MTIRMIRKGIGKKSRKRIMKEILKTHGLIHIDKARTLSIIPFSKLQKGQNCRGSGKSFIGPFCSIKIGRKSPTCVLASLFGRWLSHWQNLIRAELCCFCWTITEWFELGRMMKITTTTATNDDEFGRNWSPGKVPLIFEPNRLKLKILNKKELPEKRILKLR